MRLRSKATALAIAAVAAAALTGCGGGDETPEPAAKAPASLTRPASDRPKDDRPRAALLLLAGGGWKASTVDGQRQLSGGSAALRKQGIATDAVGYRAGPLALRDALAQYDRTRRQVGKDVPICALGVSAGGHLALMLAVRRPELACAISQAGPTDLTRAPDDGEANGLRSLASAAFLRRDFAPLSPARHANRIKARVLMVMASNDKVVPISQGRIMKQALPSSQLIVLPPGNQPFIHSAVEPQARARADQQVNRLILQVARG